MIVLDMDGVLVDFVAGAFAAHGRVPVPITHYDEIQDVLPDLYKPMDRGFWAGLPWTPEGKAILAACEARDDVMIASSPVAGSMDGKYDWICREAPAYRNRFAFTPDKRVLGGLLVDDSPAQLAGRPSIRCPRPWNGGGDTLEYITCKLVEWYGS